jgi:hypothetical protein
MPRGTVLKSKPTISVAIPPLDRTLTYTGSGELGVANALSGDLVVNGGFENDLAGWTAASGSLTISTSGPHAGAKCCQVTGAGNGAYQTAPFTWVGQAAAIRCWVKAGSSGNAGVAKIYYEFQDATGGVLLSGNTAGLSASTTWQQIVLITGNAPAGTAQVKVVFCLLASSPTGNWFVDDCSCEELPGSLQGVTIDPVTGFLVLNQGQGLTQDSSGVYIANGALSNAFFAALSIATTNLQNGAVATAKIASGAVTTTTIANAAITNALIANAAIGTANIQSAAITNALIANAAITNALIANLAVGTANIQNAAVTNAILANASVGTANIQSLAVGSAQIANLAVGTAQIANLAVTNAKINDLDVSKLNAGTINVSVVLNAATINSGAIVGGTISIVTTGGTVAVNSGSTGVHVTSGSYTGFYGSNLLNVVDGSGIGSLGTTSVAVGNPLASTSLSSVNGVRIGGTQVLDTSRNLLNIVDITASGTVTCGGVLAGANGVQCGGVNPLVGGTQYFGATSSYTGVLNSVTTQYVLVYDVNTASYKSGYLLASYAASNFNFKGGVLT